MTKLISLLLLVSIYIACTENTDEAEIDDFNNFCNNYPAEYTFSYALSVTTKMIIIDGLPIEQPGETIDSSRREFISSIILLNDSIISMQLSDGRILDYCFVKHDECIRVKFEDSTNNLIKVKTSHKLSPDCTEMSDHTLLISAYKNDGLNSGELGHISQYCVKPSTEIIKEKINVLIELYGEKLDSSVTVSILSYGYRL